MHIVPPESGPLASGREGQGRLAELETILREVERVVSRKTDFEGQSVLITAGPTHEPIDPVRILTNRSTGAMGIALAEAARDRGAKVSLVLGPTHLAPPEGVRVLRVETAEEMHRAATSLVADADVIIAAAAVSDFRPKDARGQKLKRSDPTARVLELEENPDVIKSLSENKKPSCVVVGFAAETEASDGKRAQHGRDKLQRKSLDLIVVNRVGNDVGFGPKETSVSVLDQSGAALEHGPAPKRDVADFVLDQVGLVRPKLKARRKEAPADEQR